MTEGVTCYERDETLCEDQMCLRTGCRLRNERLGAMTEKHSPLLPCPFCGSTPRMIDGRDVNVGYFVKCEPCALCLPASVCSSQEAAAKAWNTRAVNGLPEAIAALEKLALAYVNLLEVGRDRIVALGGDCDPVDVMEAGDPVLHATRAVLTKLKG